MANEPDPKDDKKPKLIKVKVTENGGVHEGGKFFAKGETLEVTEKRAEGLGDSVEKAK